MSIHSDISPTPTDSYRLRTIGPNFGDALNDFIWGPLNIQIPKGVAFFGIGTLLCQHFFDTCTSEGQEIICVGSGAGLGALPTQKSLDRVNFLFVRGPLTAKSLGLDSSIALSDPALLLGLDPVRTRILSKANLSTTKTNNICVIPHYSNPAIPLIRKACSNLEYTYIDPLDTVPNILSAISGSSLVLAEAMHGAIAADALSIPWVPFVRSPRLVTQFKWLDWCSSLGIDYAPLVQPSVDLRDFLTRWRDASRPGPLAHNLVDQSARMRFLDQSSKLLSVTSRLYAGLRDASFRDQAKLDAKADEIGSFLKGLTLIRPKLSARSAKNSLTAKILDELKRSTLIQQ